MQTELNDAKMTDAEASVIWMELSENTRRNYECAYKHFIECGFKMPANRNDLLEWIRIMASSGNCVNTIKLNLNGIKFIHGLNGYDCNINHMLIRAELIKTGRTQGRELRQAYALSLGEVRRIVDTCDTTKKGTRDKVLILTGYFGAFRRAELLSIDMTDITFSNEGMTINIPVSKTGINQKVSIPCRGDNLCPCRGVRDLMEVLQLDGIIEGRLFRTINRWGKWGDSYSDTGMVNMLKQRAGDCGMDPTLISGHSLRRGITTELINNGVSSFKVARHGRWAGVNGVACYYSPDPFKDNALNELIIKQVVDESNQL
jgi:integrase